MNVKEGFEGLYQMGDKSGIRRCYGRVWKNIFYEMGDKEREGGFLGMGGREERKRERVGGFFGLSGRRDVIWNIP